jgi:GTP-binding protein
MTVRAARLLASAAGPEGFPPGGLPEVALLGRSNSGKSSLLNRLAARRALARTSATPGKTRLLHFYRVERGRDALVLVDLPGYGFARVARRERAGWRALVERYLSGRAALRAAVVLHDARRELSEDEHELLAWLAARGVPALAAWTKVDKLRAAERARRLAALAAALDLSPERVVATSAATGDGVAALWRAIDRLLAERPP